MTWQSGVKLHNNQYQIIGELGWGRVAVTYLAKDRNGKDVVIKTLQPHLLSQLSTQECDRLLGGFRDESRKLER